MRSSCPRPPPPLPSGQQFKVLTAHKPLGRRWVTKEQYTRYCVLAAQVLNPDCPPEEELRRGLEVGVLALPCLALPPPHC
jgi:hypothetical protein